MATKKHSQRTSADKTTKGRQSKVAKDEAAPPEITTQAEPVPVEAAEGANDLTSETTADTPMPTEVQTIAADPTRSNQTVPVKKLSAVDAAARVLGESGQAMNCQELIAAMAAKGYWSSPKGRTPASTLYAALLRERKTKGDNTRFIKMARGKFQLRREG